MTTDYHARLHRQPMTADECRLARLLGEMPYPERLKVEEPNYRGLMEICVLALIVASGLFTFATWVGLL